MYDTRIVQAHFSIPNDFEILKQQFGALSGTCFEERLVAAYELGLLEPCGAMPLEGFCSSCGCEGHLGKYCPRELERPGGSWSGAACQVPPPSPPPSSHASPGDPAAVQVAATSAQGVYAGTAARSTPDRKTSAAKKCPPARKSARKLLPVPEVATEAETEG